MCANDKCFNFSLNEYNLLWTKQFVILKVLHNYSMGWSGMLIKLD